MEQCATAFLGTISLHIVWRTILFLLLFTPCSRLHLRDLLLDLSRFLGLALRLPRSCLSMPPGKRLALAQQAERG